MNFNQIINMVVRIVMRQVVGRGINAGINAAGRKMGKSGGTREAGSGRPADGGDMDANVKKTMKATRRAGRF